MVKMRDQSPASESNEEAREECHCCCCKRLESSNPEKRKARRRSASEEKSQTEGEKNAESKPRTKIGRHKKDKDDEKSSWLDDADMQEDADDIDALKKRFALTIDDRWDSEVRFLSSYVRTMVQETVKAYPTVTYAKTYLAMITPYEPMFHYYHEMKAWTERNPPNAEEEIDLKAFTLWYEKDVKPGFDLIQATIDEGFVRFDDLWAIFRPKDLVFTVDDLGQPRLGVVISTSIEVGWNGRYGRQEKICFIEVWWIQWDRNSQTFTRAYRSIDIKDYAGSRQITSLPVYPLKYHSGSLVIQGQRKNLMDHLEGRGHMYRKLVSVQSICMNHQGTAETFQVIKRRSLIDGRVIVDEDEGEIREIDIRYYEDRFSEDRGAPKPMRGVGKDDRYIDWDDFPRDKEFSALQAQLCPSIVKCFSLENLEWYNVLVDNLQETKWKSEAFNHLVLDESSKKMLKGLVEQHKRNKPNIMLDVIENKGAGLVIVLHGPPGVGKTLTAEAVAEYTQKPLYQVSVGDITSESKGNSSRAYVEDIFKRSSRWDAVMLIDEADVILEKRSLEDFDRNSLVSIFLRALEYHKGILFITTNRLRTIDVAFQSRIHIALKYAALVPAVRRQIWEKFIDRLDASEVRAKDELSERLDDLQEWNLNGRQIRNIIMIAQSLSLSLERRRGALSYADIEAVANKTLEFQDFFEEDANDRRSQLSKVSNAAGNRQYRQTTAWR